MKKEELQLIIDEGEGYRIEFKESLKNIDKEMVAFANSSGGRIFLGIKDNKEIVRIKSSNKLKSQIYDTTVTCALYKGTEKVDVLDRRDFNEDIVSNIDGAMNFLKRYIPVKYEMTGEPRRKEIPEFPYDALREAIINAVTHRDYFEKGCNVMVEMFDDRIEIYNFGGLVSGLKPEDFGKKSVLRNPSIANLLHRIGYIEKMGTGIRKMQRLIQEAGLPPINFEFGNFFNAIFKRTMKSKDNIETSLYEAVNEAVKKRLTETLSHIKQREMITLNMLIEIFNTSRATVQRDIVILKNIGFIKFTGAPKTGGYVLTEKGKKIF